MYNHFRQYYSPGIESFLKGYLDWDSLVTQTLNYASVGTLLRRLKLPSCVGFEESAGRLTRDSWRRDLESQTVDTTERGCQFSPWLAPSYQEILFSYCWKNGDSYINCLRTLSLFY